MVGFGLRESKPMFTGRSVPLSQESTGSLVPGLIWISLWMCLAVGSMGTLLYQGGFRGAGVVIPMPALALFLWIGGAGIWSILRELIRRRRRSHGPDAGKEPE